MTVLLLESTNVTPSASCGGRRIAGVLLLAVGIVAIVAGALFLGMPSLLLAGASFVVTAVIIGSSLGGGVITVIAGIVILCLKEIVKRAPREDDEGYINLRDPRSFSR